MADLNGDGRDDLIIGSGQGFIVFCLRTRIGFAPPVNLSTPQGVELVFPLNSTSPAPCDFDGDGDFDLLVGTSTDGIYILENVGSTDLKVPRFNKRGHYEPELGGFDLKGLGTVSHFLVADWDGDHEPDLMVGTHQGAVFWLKGRKAKTLKNRFTFPRLLVAPRTAAAPMDAELVRTMGIRTRSAIADWNLDGKLDIIIGDFHSTPKFRARRTLGKKALVRFIAAQNSYRTALVKKAEHFLRMTYWGEGWRQPELADAYRAKFEAAEKNRQRAVKILRRLGEKTESSYIVHRTRRRPAHGYIWVLLRK